MAAVEVDEVPWAMGGGAENSAASARLATYAATGGAQGVILPGDLKVTPLDVPGAGVQIAAGGALVRNRAQGGGAETFVTRVAAPGDFTGLAGTGSSGGRSDLIISEVLPNATDGRYHRVDVVSGVPAGTKRLQDVAQYAGRSAETLARIDYPASTSTVTAAMIADLRRVARPRTETQETVLRTADVELTGTSRMTWPVPTFDVDVPEWATHVVLTVTLAGYLQRYGAADAYLWVQLGTGSTFSDFGQLTLDSDALTDGVALTSILFGSGVVPAAARGQRRTVRMQGQNYAGRNGRFATGLGTQVGIVAKFLEKAV